jgi:molybdate/tungstate transport system substrate-binding protein
MIGRTAFLAVLACLAGLAGSAGGAAQTPVTFTVFAAGTLAVPLRTLDAAFEKKYPGVTIHPQFGGSVMMAKRITELHQAADVLAVADYSVIPKYLFGNGGKTRSANWYVGFARNAITFVYTKKSKYAAAISADNWYRYLSRPGVQIGRSDPDTDPSGYQTVQMLALATEYYRVPDLAAKLLANAPRENMRDTETSLISALQLGQLDYLAIYRSDALQHHLQYLKLPAQIDLSDPLYAARYARARVRTKNGELRCKPIVYAVTAPIAAEHPEWAAKYVAFLLGPEGRKIIAHSGFGALSPAYVVNPDKMPASLRSLVKPWPNG